MYPCIENKGADQLRSHYKAVLCFRLCILLVFSCGGSINTNKREQYGSHLDSSQGLRISPRGIGSRHHLHCNVKRHMISSTWA